MMEAELRTLLAEVKAGKKSIDEALGKLKHLPFENLGFARIDHHRSIRQGFPEVIFGRGKTVQQIVAIVKRMLANQHNILITHSDRGTFQQIKKLDRRTKFYKDSKAVVVWRDNTSHGKGKILVVSAGTADIPVAEEALVMGNNVENLYDVGVAGIHRLLSERDLLLKARVIVVVAGMEGALPSVVGGLVSVPVIAVPTSVGYGASLQGITALLGMLNSCSSNVTVVNIDNGFGAGYVASLINRL
jgi:NCAIR mutase (PurE)-related protein